MTARRVDHVADLVGLGADRRRVRDSNGAPSRLSDTRVTRIRQCWRVTGEPNQRTKVYSRADVALARRHHDVLVAAKVAGTPVGVDGFPLTTEEMARPAGKRYTFRSYLTAVYIPAHPNWGPKHRGNTVSIGNIVATLLVYPTDDPRGVEGDEIWMDEISSDDCDRMIQKRRSMRRNGSRPAGDTAVGARTEQAAGKLASAVFAHAIDRTPPVISRNPMSGVGFRTPTDEVRSRAEEEDVAWSSTDVDLLAAAIDPHFASLVLCRGRTALRPSEAAFLEPDDIDLTNLILEARGTLHIETREHNGGKKYRVAPLKRRKPGETRKVPIADHAPLINALSEAIAAAPGLNASRRLELTARRTAAQECGDMTEVARLDEELDELAVVRVFRNPDGSAIDWNAFGDDYWKPALEVAFVDAPEDDDAALAHKARRRATTFYELRHMAEAIWHYERDVPLKAIADWAGTNLSTLMRHYTRRSAPHEEKAWGQATQTTGANHTDGGFGHMATPDTPDGSIIDLEARRIARKKAR